MKPADWTPEQILQAAKEGVTALLGVFLVVYTLYLASQVFTYVGDQNKISDAKDVLMLILGLAGVVIGYYFGRVPADARATQAQVQANTATAKAERVSAKAESAADQVDQIISRMAAPTGAAARGIAATPGTGVTVEEMKGISGTLRQALSTAH